MIYLYSDPHFGHRNLAEVFTLRDGTPARPFDTVEQMNEVLFSRYCETVRPSDVVWWLGDVCFKPTQVLIERIAALPGTKHLIFGNHDRESVGRYQRMGFQKLRSSWRTERKLLLTHIPVHPSAVPYEGLNIHGHTHSTCHGLPYVNVSVEQTDYRPITLRAAAELVQIPTNPDAH